MHRSLEPTIKKTAIFSFCLFMIEATKMKNGHNQKVSNTEMYTAIFTSINYRIHLNAAPLLNRTPPKVQISPLGLISINSFESTVVHVCI